MNDLLTSASIGAVVVNYNGAEFLQACLDSLQAQSLPPNRVIVIDNASTDGSAEIAAQHSLGIELIRNMRNEGFAAANNQAIALVSECEWIALLNPDAVANPHWLETLFKAAQEHPQHCSFASLQRVAGDTEQCDGRGDCYHAFGYGWRIGHNLPVPQNLPEYAEVFASCAAACLVKRSAIEKVGGFDTEYFCYGEDLDLGFRLRLANGRALFVRDAEVLHHQSAITGLNSPFSIYHGQRNLVWTFFKNMPFPLLIALLLPHLLLNLLAVAAYAVRGQHQTILRAKYDALKGLPALFKKRQLIQTRTNRIPTRELMHSMEFSMATLFKRLVSAQ